MAEKALHDFRNSKVTKPLVHFVKMQREKPDTGYEFPDGSTLTVSGRGRSHKVTVGWE